MKQLLKDEELIGKIIIRTGYTDTLYVLFFDDKTYAVFQGCGWQSHDIELMDETYSLEPTISNARELHDMGIITDEKRNEIQNQYHADLKIKEDEQERKEYERLKQKFESE